MMHPTRWLTAIGLGLTILSCAPVAAQAPNMTAQEKKNLQLVLDWWRVLQSGHVELVPTYIAPDVIQHNPNFGQGMAAIQTLLARRTPINPMPATLTPQQMPALTLSQGEIVTLIWDREAKDPADSSKTYHYNAFDAFRVKSGRITEHWDAALKNPPTQ
jgi:predicted SnoaL-like aldol condensation-catalyzing enzyme